MATGKPRSFVREATGLVREFSVFNAVSLNFGGFGQWAGLLTVFSYAFLFPNANLPLAMLLTVLLFTPLALCYTLIMVAMPRAGADYVFISRTLHPALGFMSFITTAWIWFYFFVATYMNWLFTLALAPALSTIGSVLPGYGYLTTLVTAITAPTFVIIAGSVLIILGGVLAIVSSKWSMRIMSWSIVLSLVSALAIALVFLMSSNQSFHAAFNSYSAKFTNDPDYYDTILSVAQKNGLGSTGGFSWSDTLSMIPFGGYIFLFISMHGLGGEIKNPRRSSYVAILLTLGIAGLLAVFSAATFTNTVTPQFYNAITYVYFSGFPYSLPVAPTFNLLASVLTDNVVVLVLLNIGMIALAVAELMFCYLLSSRYILATAFDRILPERFASVSDRFHTPYVGVLMVMILTLILLPLYTYFASILATVSAFAGELLFGFMVGAISCMVFPFMKQTKKIYEESPINKSVGGIPVLTIVGTLNLIVLLFITYLFLGNAAYGVNSLTSLVAVLVVAASAPIWYFGRKWYLRSREGLDLGLAFTAVPPE